MLEINRFHGKIKAAISRVFTRFIGDFQCVSIGVVMFPRSVDRLAPGGSTYSAPVSAYRAILREMGNYEAVTHLLSIELEVFSCDGGGGDGSNSARGYEIRVAFQEPPGGDIVESLSKITLGFASLLSKSEPDHRDCECLESPYAGISSRSPSVPAGHPIL
jgi:hypothetical protein